MPALKAGIVFSHISASDHPLYSLRGCTSHMERRGFVPVAVPHPARSFCLLGHVTLCVPCPTR